MSEGSPETGTKSGNPAPRLTGPLASRGPVSGRHGPDAAVSFSCLIYYIWADSICSHPRGIDVRLRTATAGSDVAQSGRPILDDFFQHLGPYIGNNTANVVFQSFTPNAAVLFVGVVIQPEVRFIAKQKFAYENREQRQSRFGPIRRIYALLGDRLDELPNQTENKSLDSC
ncbi:adhesion G protein-coupled receptor B2 [Trichonephila clavipes]|nr:adhesion G protein-coupled receptor B2 [Trichonephila clavipes]